jgi:hypothetical protein
MERPVPRGVSRGARDGSSLRRRDRATNPIVVPCAGGDSFRPAFAPSIAPLPAGLRHRMKVRCAIDVSPTTCLSRREQADLPAGHSLSRTGTRGQQAPLAPSSRWRRSPISEKGRRPGGEEPAARDRQGQSDRDRLAHGMATALTGGPYRLDPAPSVGLSDCWRKHAISGVCYRNFAHPLGGLPDLVRAAPAVRFRVRRRPESM